MKPLIAAAGAVAVAAAVAVAVLLTRRAGAGPDPYAGSYPLVTPAPAATASPAPTWRPEGRPAGPLPVFRGQGSRVAGRIVDRRAGISYPRFARPWRVPAVLSGGHTAGQEINSRRKDYRHFWYVAVYSGPLDPRFDVPGRDRLRAAAELVGRDFIHLLYGDEGDRRDLAGAPLRVDGRPAWVTAFRMTRPKGTGRVEKSQTEVVVVVDTGRRRPAVVEITVPDVMDRLLPDITTVVRSLRVVR